MPVVDLAPEDECEHEMFVMVIWEHRKLAVPLAQLEPLKPDKTTEEAIKDWHYSVQQGYEFWAKTQWKRRE